MDNSHLPIVEIEWEVILDASTENLSRTFYFGVSVEVVYGMETCSLVRFSGQNLIVDTVDLSPVQRIQPGLIRPRSLERSCPEPVAFCAPAWDNTIASGVESGWRSIVLTTPSLVPHKIFFPGDSSAFTSPRAQ
jgi:hypothetical protein